LCCLFAFTSKELSVLVLELVADIVHLARGYGFLQDQGHGAGVTEGLGLLEALRLGDSPVELRERKVFAPAFSF
jgi:hypothetical protein